MKFKIEVNHGNKKWCYSCYTLSTLQKQARVVIPFKATLLAHLTRTFRSGQKFNHRMMIFKWSGQDSTKAARAHTWKRIPPLLQRARRGLCKALRPPNEVEEEEVTCCIGPCKAHKK